MTSDPAPNHKLPYHTPDIINFGALEKTTQAGASSVFDPTSSVVCMDVDC